MRLHHDGAISSVGRASPLQGGGHQFESGIAHHISRSDKNDFMIGRLAQLVEHLPYKEGVISSNLVSPTNHKSVVLMSVIVIVKWAISSVGRAPPLQGGGHQFESGIAHHFIGLFRLQYHIDI